MDTETKNAILKILDFVERWNKQDAEKEIADASQVLENYLEDELLKNK